MEDLDAWWFKNFPFKQRKDIEHISAGPKYCLTPCEHSLNEGFLDEDLITTHLHTKKTQIVEHFSSSKSQGMAIVLAPVVQTLHSAIHRINHYPADTYWGN